jgi:hypothetical protein
VNIQLPVLESRVEARIFIVAIDQRDRLAVLEHHGGHALCDFGFADAPFVAMYEKNPLHRSPP